MTMYAGMYTFRSLIFHLCGYTFHSCSLCSLGLHQGEQLSLHHSPQGVLIKIGTKSSLSQYCIPYTTGAHLFCCAPLESQFLRLAVAVKTKILMIAYKHEAIMTVNGSPMTPTISANPMDNFIKHRVNLSASGMF